jgi:integrase
MQMVERNVAALAQLPRQQRTERHPFSAEEARAFIAAAEDDRLAALWRLAVTLGLRQGEVLGLRWGDVDLDGATLRVERSLQRIDGALVAKEPKTNRSRRTLALPRSLVAALRAHRDRQAFEATAAGGRWADSGYVFVTQVGTPIDPDNLSKRYKALLKAAGLRDQRFHDLRHAAATPLIAEGLPINVVSEMLGHAQTSTTINVYGHVLPLAQRHAAEAMERLLGWSWVASADALVCLGPFQAVGVVPRPHRVPPGPDTGGRESLLP